MAHLLLSKYSTELKFRGRVVQAQVFDKGHPVAILAVCPAFGYAGKKSKLWTELIVMETHELYADSHAG